MKETTRQQIRDRMSRVSKCMSKKQRQENGRKAWETYVANLEKKAKA